MKFDRDDVYAWLAGRLGDPDRVRAIEADIQRGDQGDVGPLLKRVADKARRFKAMVESGELAQQSARRRRLREPTDDTEDENDEADASKETKAPASVPSSEVPTGTSDTSAAGGLARHLWEQVDQLFSFNPSAGFSTGIGSLAAWEAAPETAPEHAGQNYKQRELRSYKSRDGAITASLRHTKSGELEVSFETTDRSLAGRKIAFALIEPVSNQPKIADMVVVEAVEDSGVLEGVWRGKVLFLEPCAFVFRLEPDSSGDQG